MDSDLGDEGLSGNTPSADYEPLLRTRDSLLLKRAWRSEKAAPEIIQFEAVLVQMSWAQIQLMEETVEEFARSGIDPLTVSLYQMDLDRTLFLLRSYLRTRLQKIEKYTLYIRKTTELWNRLSRLEQRFTERCIEDMEQHLEQSVLSKLHSSYRSLLKQSSSSEEDDMVPEPKLDAYVICRATEYTGTLQLDDSGEPTIFEAGDLYVLPYKSIEALVESGDVEKPKIDLV